jgi:hypothetical protein
MKVEYKITPDFSLWLLIILIVRTLVRNLVEKKQKIVKCLEMV